MSKLPRVARPTTFREAMKKAFIGSEAAREAGLLEPVQGLPGGGGILAEEAKAVALSPIVEEMTKEANAGVKALGVMVALMLPSDASSKLAIQGGEDPASMHITLAYLGKKTDLPSDVEERVAKAMEACAAKNDIIHGNVSGVGRFGASSSSDGQDVIYASYDAPYLNSLRESLIQELRAQDLYPKMDHGFTPHITLAYVNSAVYDPIQAVERLPLSFSEMCLVVGSDIKKISPLGPYAVTSMEKCDQASNHDLSGYVPIVKSDQEKRLVTGIVLEPDEIDAQKHTISPDVIEVAAHNFLARYNHMTRMGVMHKMFGDVGIELVESYIAPEDTTLGGQKVKKGSWIMTVKVINDILWGKIKDGLITGFSIGGVATVI